MPRLVFNTLVHKFLNFLAIMNETYSFREDGCVAYQKLCIIIIIIIIIIIFKKK